jgi:hypothetical protein
MQIKLEQSELYYLLQSHNATQVLGLDDSYFQPESDALHRQHLQEGFESLIQHGWLVPDGQGYRTNTAMMLLTAVLAAPEWVLVVIRVVPGQGEQILTYSLAQEYLVEQFRAEDGAYIVTRLEDRQMLLERLYAAFQIPETHACAVEVEVDPAAFGRAPKDSEAESLVFWRQQLPDPHRDLSERFTQLHGQGRIQAVSLTGDQPALQVDLIIVQDSRGESWSIVELPSGQARLSPLTQAQMAEFIKSIYPVMV